MKEDIMIGDYLRTNKGTVIKVESISTKHQNRKVGYHLPDDQYHIKYVRLSQCYPILLTEEFLLDNGFEKKDNNRYYKGEIFKWSVDVSLFVDGSFIMVTNDLDHRGVNNAHICDNGYVHILQHALRMCGIEMSFEVE